MHITLRCGGTILYISDWLDTERGRRRRVAHFGQPLTCLLNFARITICAIQQRMSAVHEGLLFARLHDKPRAYSISMNQLHGTVTSDAMRFRVLRLVLRFDFIEFMSATQPIRFDSARGIARRGAAHSFRFVE